MRTAIIRGFDYFFLREFIPRLSRELDLEKIYWITHFLTEIPEDLKEVVEIVDVAYLNFFKDVDFNKYIPIDEELVDRLKNTESHVMAMNSRLGHFHLNHEMFRKRYLRTLRYWNHKLSQEDIQLVLFDILPHSPFDYPIYELCKIHNRPFLFLDNFATGLTALWNDWDKHPIGLKEKLERIYQENPKTEELSISIDSLSIPAQAIWNKQMGIDSKDLTPFYMSKGFEKESRRKYRKMKNMRRKAKLKKNLQNLNTYFSWKGLYDMINYFGKKFLVNQIKKRHLKARLKALSGNTIPKDQKFLYVALHLQPEVSTGPRAGAYMDQQLIVEMLSAIVPDDVLILVKENPRQSALYRDVDYYDDLAKLRNVKLLSKSVNTFDLINNCIAVVTATGSAGWEALFRGKNAIVFGHPYYGLCKGVFLVKTKKDCIAALDAISKGENLPVLEDLFLFLQSLDQIAVKANLSDYQQLVFPMPENENNDALIHAIKKEFASHSFS